MKRTERREGHDLLVDMRVVRNEDFGAVLVIIYFTTKAVYC